MRFLRVISILCACAAATTSVSAQGKPPGIKAVRFGKLWDGSGKVWSNAIVIVQGERIRAVTTDAATIPPGAEVIDLSRFTGLPGVIDAHTYMTNYREEALGVILHVHERVNDNRKNTRLNSSHVKISYAVL